MVSKRYFFVFSLLLLVGSLVLSATFSQARWLEPPTSSGERGATGGSVAKLTGEVCTPSPPQLTWIGTGRLCQFTVSNAALIGLYEPPPDWDGTYDGTVPTGYTVWNGYVADWPCGSKQYYLFSSGIWLGAICPNILGTDTLGYEPRVLTGAYTPDCSAMEPLYLSSQLIRQGEEGGGGPLFAAAGSEPQSYQKKWVYADTASINEKRREQIRKYGVVLPLLDADNGDRVSLQDSWAVMGDCVPEKDAAFLWPAFGYDTKPLGVRLEQRTYSWNYGPSNDYIYINIRIRNMNDYPLDSVYIGYFIDADIGPGELSAQGMGPNDDLIGFDKELNLGYQYDENLSEPGWATPAGYIGAVFCETPTNPGEEEPMGLTALSTWERSDQGPEGFCDDDGRDDLKYAELTGVNIPNDSKPDDIFETFDEPKDVRMLLCSGPYHRLLPYETDSVELAFTMAIVMGHSLAELKENVIAAQTQFSMGYISTAPPPPPHLTLTPGDEKVYLSWDNFPEEQEDIITKKKDFQGYRAYRSETGLPDDWELLADYDIKGDSSENVVVVKYTRGNSKINLGPRGFYNTAGGMLKFLGHSYTIRFASDTSFTVHNNTLGTPYKFIPYTFQHTDPYDEKTGRWLAQFSIVHRTATGGLEPEYENWPPWDPTPYYEGKYISGSLIYIDDFLITIRDSTRTGEADEDTLVPLSPRTGDIISIQTYTKQELGGQTGLKYSYVDDDGLMNGRTYYYAVTSYDKGDKSAGVSSLESGKVKYSVVPRSYASDIYEPIVDVKHIQGLAEGEVRVSVVIPDSLKSHNYQVEFNTSDTSIGLASSWNLVDLTEDTTILQGITGHNGEVSAQQVLNGFEISVDGDFKPRVYAKTVMKPDTATGGLDTLLYAGEWNNEDVTYQFILESDGAAEPYDYQITFPDTGSTGFDASGNPIHFPWLVTNVTLGEQAWTTLNIDGLLWILKMNIPGTGAEDGDKALELIPTWLEEYWPEYADTSHPPGPGDVYTIRLSRAFTNGDVYRFSTHSVSEKKTEYSLDKVNVVPNPYYVRAMWDSDRFNQAVIFTHLPSACKIRIFTVSGLLIRTIEHLSEGGGGVEGWDLLTDEGMKCVSGLYVYQVKDENSGKTKVGKLAIIR